MNGTKVLVTGGSGYVAGFCMLELLDKGYSVKTTIRSLSKAGEVRETLRPVAGDKVDGIEFVEAELLNDRNWDQAVRDCEYVLHVASPLGLAHPKHEDDMIRPAVEGTLRVLRASRDGGIRRVVMTSNFGAVGYSFKDKNGIITEESWTDPNEPGLSAYNKSKVLAERAAWDFVRNEGGALELTVLNPVAVSGPLLGPKLSGGHGMILPMLDGRTKAVPKIELSLVDVRDLADLHVRAMTSAVAKGQRFLALSDGTFSLLEASRFVRGDRPDLAPKAATKILPTWILALAAGFNPMAKGLLAMVGVNRNASNKKAVSLLGWKPRSKEDIIRATIDSLERYGYLKKSGV